MPKCSKCGVTIRTGTLCEIHAVEQRAAGVEHDLDVDAICVGCGAFAPEGDYSDERPGMWFCRGCSGLALGQAAREQIAAVTEELHVGEMGAVIRWASGDDSAYPEDTRSWMTGESPFQTATELAIADGGRAGGLISDTLSCGQCDQEFESADEFANHRCPETPVPMVRSVSGTAVSVAGPDPEAFDAYHGGERQ